MIATQNTYSFSLVMLPGILVVLLGSMVLFGWVFDIPLLTQIHQSWKPMVPSTALCFILSGLLLLDRKSVAGGSISARRAVFIGLILLMTAARLLELVTGHSLGVDFLYSGPGTHPDQDGHMSSLTVAGFAIFAVGMLLGQLSQSPRMQRLAAALAGVMMLVAVATMIGYWLDLQLVFEEFYSTTGIVWMALHTAAGMFVLGLGLLCNSLLCNERSDVVDPIAKKASLIYRMTLLVLSVTAVLTGLVGISFLKVTLEEETAVSLSRILSTRIAFFDNNLHNRTQRALVVSLEPELRSAATILLANPGQKAALEQARRFAEPLSNHGFTGICVESDGQRIPIMGHLSSTTIPAAHLKGDDDAALIWDDRYILRVRIPLLRSMNSGNEGFLVIEQALPNLENIFAEANRFGETGTMPMCARLDKKQLLCFPQREQAAYYVVPDDYAGNPLPMTFALNGSSGVAALVDYRGHNVLSAYGPVGNTGLGLVLRQDLAEVLSPIRQELLFAIPFIFTLVALGLWLINSRVRPLITDIISAYAAENTAKERFDAAMQSSPDAFVISSCVTNDAGEIVDFRCEYLNHQAMLLAAQINPNLPKDLLQNLEGQLYLEVFPDEQVMVDKFKSVVLTGQLQLEEFSVTDKQGTECWYMRQIVPMARGIAATYRDITMERRLLQQLQLSTQLQTAIVEGAAYSIISTEVDGTIRTFNQAAERMLYYSADEMIGKATPGVFHDAEEVSDRAQSLSKELGYTIEPGFEVFVAKPKIESREDREWTYVRKDGTRFPVRLSVTALRDDEGKLQGFLGIAYDISEQKRSEEYMRHIALHDVLTGLPNRALLDDRITAAIQQQRRNDTPFALALIDVDRFKQINDSLGHHVGDLILKEFVRRVSSCLRPTDTLARLGGDEFVLLMVDSDKAGTEVVMERIQKSLELPFEVEQHKVTVTSSIGVSLSPRHGIVVDELMRCADMAMYWVKERGRNDFKVYSPEMGSGGSDHLNLEKDLRSALENGGFALFYQPRLDLASNTVLGVEALIRMRNMEGQYLMPGDFIHQAEALGLIGEIGQWALETACNDLIRLKKSLGTTLFMEVNISTRQFTSGELVSQVRSILKKTRLAARLLELKITEDALIDVNNIVSESLTSLHGLGVRIAIDYFGTGYSSLSYLQHFPISTLKIDPSFVRDMSPDTEDASLVKAIIATGHSLNIPVVAEGIETAEQLAFLAESGCDQGQGYYIGRPMPFDTLVQWLASDNGWSLGKGRKKSH